MLHKLHCKQFIKATREEAWEFFCNPWNLPLITPPHLGFEITNDPPKKIYSGQILSYKVTPLLGIPLTWVSEITHVKEGELFVDEQRVGPYSIWHHEHHFNEVDGGIEVEDIIHYKLPMWVFGDIANKLFVKRDLEKIFTYRERVLDEKFNKNPV